MTYNAIWWREYYKKNKDKIKELSKLSYQKNKDYKKEYYQKHKDRIMQYQKNYQLKYYHEKIKPHTKKKLKKTKIENKQTTVFFN